MVDATKGIRAAVKINSKYPLIVENYKLKFFVSCIVLQLVADYIACNNEGIEEEYNKALCKLGEEYLFVYEFKKLARPDSNGGIYLLREI